MGSQVWAMLPMRKECTKCYDNANEGVEEKVNLLQKSGMGREKVLKGVAFELSIKS